jgi:hypothetical protein
LSTKEIKFVCISELDTNLLVDNVHPSFAGVVLFQLYFMTRTGIQTIHFVGKKDDILDVDVFGSATDAIVCLDVNACCINVVVQDHSPTL